MPQPITVSDGDLDIATRVLWGESRGASREAQIGVAWVIRTRASWSPPTWWGKTVAEVCTRPHQFSCLNPLDPNSAKCHRLLPSDPSYVALHKVASAVFAGEVEDPTGSATHYENVGGGATWADRREFRCIIGPFAFYRIGPSE